MKKYLLATFIFLSLTSGSTVFAQTKAANVGYVPLEPIPGVTATNGTYDPTAPGQFIQIVNALYKILITGGALLAVLSLTIGGVQYMTASSVGNKTQGIDRAKASMWGILLIAATWLILNTVNPQLLNFNFNPCPVNSSVCTSIAGSSVFTNPNINNTDSIGSNPQKLSDETIQNFNDNKANPDPQACADVRAFLNPQTFSQYFTYYASKLKYKSDDNASGFQKADQANSMMQDYVSACAARGL